MKTIKNNLRSLFLSGALLLTTFANAQQGPKGQDKDPAERAAKRTEWMTKELSLTADQAKQIEAIHLQHITKMESVKSMADVEQQKKAKAEVRRSQQSAIQAVLTPEQQARLKELKAERKEKHQERKAQGQGKEGAAPRPATR